MNLVIYLSVHNIKKILQYRWNSFFRSEPRNATETPSIHGESKSRSGLAYIRKFAQGKLEEGPENKCQLPAFFGRHALKSLPGETG